MGNAMQKRRCTACSYVYDPRVGDPLQGVDPGTPFEDVPAEWLCPLCGVSRTLFVPVEPDGDNPPPGKHPSA
jgi:rubredoxin